MSFRAQEGPRWRNPATGSKLADTPSPGPPPGHARSKSSMTQSPTTPTRTLSHARHQSVQSIESTAAGLARSDSQRRFRSGSVRASHAAGGTFSPQFIKIDSIDGAVGGVRGNDGELDASGKRYVWVKDPNTAFVKGFVLEHHDEGGALSGMLKVQCDDGSQRDVPEDSVDKVNPAKFDKADDMAELTHLNEASVVNNLHQRYQADLIYTYSGLFLVTINPYAPLPIYGRDYINMYKGRTRDDTKPHIFAMADEAFRNLVDEGENQSILVTGESGAGKTENTKKVIQYLAAVATTDTPHKKSGARQLHNLSEQILRANPILEAFGNAQTLRNNNSSRFGKFIRIEFSRTGQIAGAFIEWYLLEKSRVVQISSRERNYHIFYQLLHGADASLRRDLLLGNMETDDFEYTRHGNDTINGISDREEWQGLIEAFHVMKFSDVEQKAILQTIAALLHLGNINVVKESLRADQAALAQETGDAVSKACHLLGIDSGAFKKALLHPRVRAGHEWVEKVQTPEQVRSAIAALTKGIYERGFGDLLDAGSTYNDDTTFIGVLDIAGFEIFEQNSFEQLCINYTNEKLQQFFNHHMFVLEQEEYAREQIEWKFIDFGRDLQPTIDLIELTNPIGVFSCLDEDSVMPKATDASFTDKLHHLWDKKTPKYKRSLLKQGFMLTHYAAEVEYSTEGWLEKNKDPLNDNVTRLLASSNNQHIANLFSDFADPDDGSEGATRSRVKKGLFRTLSTLMNQLHSTHPHFKRPKQFSAPLVLDQLRCNGFPNRLPFAEFRARYETFLDGQVACKTWYRVGLTKVFFRAEQRDALIRDVIMKFQCVARGFSLYRAEATRIIQRNFYVYAQLQRNPWWELFQNSEIKKHRMLKEEEARSKVEDERRRAENESERALALDKEEIFRRLQARETELTEKLEGALDDMETMEAQIEELQIARKTAGDIIAKLESDKQDLLDRISELDAHLDEVQKAKAQRIRMLQSHLSLKDRKLQDLEKKLLENDQELDLKLADATKTLGDHKKQNRSIRQQMTSLAATSTSFEDLIKHLRKYQDDRKRFEDENLQNRLRQLEREAADAKRALEEQHHANAQGELFQQSHAEYQGLKREFDALHDSKVTIEKEIRATAAKETAEEDRREKKFIDLQEAKIEVQQQAKLEGERGRLAGEVQRLKQLISDSDSFKLHHDQDKQRLEPSENDNKALLNKVQQKNLDIARSNSRATDTQRSRSRVDEEVKKLQRILNDSQLQKEKLSLSLEDLNHEIDREHKTARQAEQQASQSSLQLAEANRNQAQSNTRTANYDLTEAHEHLRLLQKVFDPASDNSAQSAERGVKPDLRQTINLAQKLESSEQALRLASDRFSRAEAQLETLRAQYSEEMQENDTKFHNSKRALLEEMNSSQVNARSSPIHFRRNFEETRKAFSPTQTPGHQRHTSNNTHDSARSDRTVDTTTLNNRMDLAGEVEMLSNQLQMSEMKNKHLQAQIERGTPVKGNWQDDSPSLRRVQKLERENFRLHDMLDDSAKKVSALEQSIRAGQLSLKEVQTKSHEELYDLINSQEQSRRSLLTSHNAAISELADAKTAFDEVKQKRASVEVELRDARSELVDIVYEREQEAANHSQLLQEFNDLQIRLDTETSNLEDAAHSLNVYKARADEYFNKLEHAEIAVLKASRAEQFARSQAKEAEDTCANVMSERKQMDSLVEDLQRQTQQYEERLEDMSADLEGALQAKKRLQNELEDYRSQRAIDIEDKESSMEQTRKKYQSELSSLNSELEIERDNVLHSRGENSRLRDELEELRSKWDDEVLNSSTWSKEKSRLEVTLQSLSDSRDEAVAAHNDAQSKIVDLLGQVRGLRTDIDDVAAERDQLVKEKKGLEARLAEAADRLDDLSHNGSPSKRDAASSDRQALELKSKLAQQEDIAAAAIGKMRRAELLAQEVQREIASERDMSVKLHKDKAALEKSVKELQLKCVDLETKGYSSGSQDVRFLHGRINELESQLESLETARTNESRSVRNVDRTVKDLQSQIDRRDKSLKLTQDDLDKSREKVERLLKTIDELQSSDSNAQLSAKRAERELREEREKSLRIEREIETLRAMRGEGERFRRSGTPFGNLSDRGGSRVGSFNLNVPNSIGGGSGESKSGDVAIEVPARKSSLSKGFL
ncbi:hypothetical protein K431DRAFT_336339 [Polychaeton citri CBS 116435]|uniref:Uncharacterized protein n=1 Tax=Polychaeton citri CBS 116435 TaxID=1314669 RepID=A0A9P4QFN7_9PEZI|nr:hypothetical protein K431DRAFT_336339 [Polychaeton citri CBS 116435]